MADPYSDLANVDLDMQTRIADAMEARCLDSAQVAMRQSYLSGLSLPSGARAVEFGSGTGHVTRDMMDMAGAAEALGIEPSPVMVERARERHGDIPGLSFQTGDAAATGLPDASVDLVMMHTLLCHAPASGEIVAEAFRILKSGGVVAVFDGDYDLTDVQIGDHDPLQPVINYMIGVNVNDRWLPRRLAPLLTDAGFVVMARQAHGYLAEGDAAYFLTVVDRGADSLSAKGTIGAEMASAIKVEGRRRVEASAFYGFMNYISVIARKP
ncbi:MAG: methyltransferase domain-containing protein [Pseudomonadota bacterium]